MHAFLLYFDTFFATDGARVAPGSPVQLVKEGDGAVAEVWRVGGEGRPRRSYSQDSPGGVAKGKARERVVSFSTGPLSVPTHWKQTIFLLREPLVVEEGECLSNMNEPYIVSDR